MALLIHTVITVLAATGLGLALLWIGFYFCLMWAIKGERNDKGKI